MERILIISDCLDVTSWTGDALLVAEACRTAGADVQVWQLGDSVSSSASSLSVENVPWPKRFCSRTVARIRRESKAFAPTQIICFGQNSITAGALCNRRESSRLVAVHGSAGPLVDGHLSWKRKWQLSQFDQHWLGHPSIVDQIQARFPSWSIDVLPRLRRPAIQVDRAKIKNELGIPPQAKLVTTAAPLMTESRLKDFIWACDLVTCIRDDVYWLIIGEGDLRWRLQRFQGCLEIGNHLQYRDWSAFSDQSIAASDIYIQTSSACQSACGLATAISNGVSCVATKEAVHADLIEHGLSGYLVERGARNEFARCVNRLVNEPEINRRFSQQSLAKSSSVLVEAIELPLVKAYTKQPNAA